MLVVGKDGNRVMIEEAMVMVASEDWYVPQVQGHGLSVQVVKQPVCLIRFVNGGSLVVDDPDRTVLDDLVNLKRFGGYGDG